MTGPFPTIPSFDGRHRGARRWSALGLLVLLGVGWSAWWRRIPSNPVAAEGGTVTRLLLNTGEARAPAGVRIRIRVVNATGRRGLARRATLQLRDYGFDVVEYESERGPALDRTEIVQHRGDVDWSARLRRALGAGQPVSRLDSLVDVELTVRLGRDWEPASEPLRP